MVRFSTPEEAYAHLALDATRWLGQAAQLEYAAKSFEPKISRFWEAELFPERTSRDSEHGLSLYLMDVHLMLMGFAIENLLKAGMVKLYGAQYRSEVLSTGRLPKELKTHDLLQLAERIGFPVDSVFHELLRRLQLSLLYAGRYPVQLSAQQPGQSDDSYHYLESEDVGEVRRLLRELVIHLGHNPDNLFEGAS